MVASEVNEHSIYQDDPAFRLALESWAARQRCRDPLLGANVVRTLTLAQAKKAFRIDPTNKTAWDYLMTAVEYGADDLIDSKTFLRVVTEVVHHIEDSVRAKPRIANADGKQTNCKASRLLH